MIANEKEALEAQLPEFSKSKLASCVHKSRGCRDEVRGAQRPDRNGEKARLIGQAAVRSVWPAGRTGLGLANADIQLKLSEGTQQSELWRVTAQISRLQKEEGDLDIKIQEVETTFKRSAMMELREVRDQLKELDVSLPAAREVRDVKLQYTGGFVRTGVRRTMTVTRVRDGRQVVIEAKETMALEPGDVVDVRRILPWQGGAGQIGSLVDGPSRQTTKVDGQDDRVSMKPE